MTLHRNGAARGAHAAFTSPQRSKARGRNASLSARFLISRAAGIGSAMGAGFAPQSRRLAECRQRKARTSLCSHFESLRLNDRGCRTVASGCRFRVSRSIEEDEGNRRADHLHFGRRSEMSHVKAQRRDLDALRWHTATVLSG